MTFTDIAERTGVHSRSMRYVFDHGVLPAAERAKRGRGFPRRFSEQESFLLACAGLLFESGLRFAVVKHCIELLDGRRAMQNAMSESQGPGYEEQVDDVAWVEVGDGVNVRFQVENTRRPRPAQRWIQAATAEYLATDYAPLAMIRVNVTKLLSRLNLR
jgi:hypothetical protein